MQETWDLGLIPGSGRSPGGGHGNPLQSSCLENPRDRGPWRAVVHEVANKRIQLKLLSMQSIIMFYFSFQCPILRDEIVYQARKICWTKGENSSNADLPSLWVHLPPFFSWLQHAACRILIPQPEIGPEIEAIHAPPIGITDWTTGPPRKSLIHLLLSARFIFKST